jgi:5-methyltetrahydrofolate--homocysteine methyltransferase
MSDLLNVIAQKLYAGDRDEVVGLIQQALAQDVNPEDILSQGLLRGMDEVGKDFKAGDLFVPEVLVSARAMQAGMEVLKPHLAPESASGVGTYLIGTVKGDLHDIGKNLVKLMLEGAGYVGTDLGTDVPPEAFADAARKLQPDIVAMSALLTTTMQHMRSTIEALEDIGIREQVKVIIGGAPVTAAFAEEIGADGYAPDAARAVDLARSLT